MKQLYLLIVITCLLFSRQLQAQNIMKLGDISVQAGQEVTLAISIDNAQPFVAFQVDIPIPTGLIYIESSAALEDARKDDHTLSASIISSNTLRLIGYSMNSLNFKGNSGAVMHFKLKAGQLPGSFSLLLTNPIIGNTASANILTSSINGTLTIRSPHIQISVATLDYGRVALGQTQDKNFTISNIGNQLLQVTGITFTNPQFTTIGGSSFSLDANGSKNIVIRFTSQVKGTYEETMSIASNDPALPIVTDTLKAVAFAVNELHAGSINALSGETKTLDFTINNMEPFTAFQFDIPLPTTMQYVAGSAILLRKQDHQVSCSMINNNTLRVVVFSASNKSFTGTDGKVLSLDFKIAGQAGWYPINLSNGIISDAAGLNAISASYNGSLQVAAAQISASQQFDFGEVSTLSSKTQSLRVSNNGGDALKINQLVFSDPSFTTTQTLPLLIPVGNYADIPVTFSKNSKGIISATLKINSNDPVTNPFTVNLNATAFAPNYINVKDFNGSIGSDVVVTIDVDNEEEFVAMQCDLKYPSYLTLKASPIVLTDRKGDHSIQSSSIGNNTIRLVAFSLTQQSFKGRAGAVIQIPFTINANAVKGSYPLEISNGILGNSASQNILKSTNNGTITINSLSNADIITGNTNVCKGVTENYTIPAIPGATSYIWTLPAGVTGTSSTNSIVVTFSNTAQTGSIKVKGHNSNGDGGESSLLITVNNVPSSAGNITGNAITYKGSTETYTVPAITGTTSYIWTLPTGVTGTSLTNSITVTISANALSGNIKVKGRNNCGDGSESSLALTVNETLKNNLTAKGNSGCSGTDVMVTLEMDNGSPIVAFQFDLKYPANLTPKTANISLTDRKADHSVQASLLENNILRVLAFSLTQQSFKGKTGAVVQIPFTINSNAVAGSYPLELSNVTLGNSQSQNILDNSYNGTVVINAGPSIAGVITGNTNICQETSNMTYTIPAITGATSYIWTLPAGATGTSAINTISLSYGRTAVSGILKVKGHNDCGDGTEANLAITVCLGVGIEDVALTNKVEIYPNPTQNIFYVTINKPFKNDFKVEVCNSFGQILQTILKNKNNNKFSVELTNYPTGLYFIRVSDKETHFHCKIIKQ